MQAWLGYTLGAFFCWGIWGFLCKLAAHRGMDWKGIYIFSGFVYVPLIVYYILTTRMAVPGPAGAKAIAAIAGTAGTAAVVCLYAALASGKLAIVLPLSSLYPALSIVLAVVFLKENLSATNVAGIVLALVSIVLLTRE
jgi:transporter family protein